jgi:adenylate cyclase
MSDGGGHPQDPELPERVSTRMPNEELRSLLRAFGAPEREIDQAEASGSLVLLAIDKLSLGEPLAYDLEEACERTGMPDDELRHIWRSLGFPDPPPGEKAFTETDLRNLASVAQLLHSGVVTPAVTYGITRVVGSSMARISSALLDAVAARAEQVLAEDAVVDEAAEEVALDALAQEADGLLPMFPAILEQVWRRHLQATARRRLLRPEAADDQGMVVGFADLVGFTAMAQQVSDEELAEIVDQFEHLAYDVVVAGGGRVVKMIGDEVMFLVEDPVAAAEIALGLADGSRQADALSDVRVGLAIGPVLEREGDAYGTTVNLASRATNIAYPGSVVVSPELREVLEDRPDFHFRGMRPRYLKNIGRVSLSVLRRTGDAPSTLRDVIEERRRVVREKLATGAVLPPLPGRFSRSGVEDDGGDAPGPEAEAPVEPAEEPSA